MRYIKPDIEINCDQSDEKEPLSYLAFNFDLNVCQPPGDFLDVRQVEQVMLESDKQG